MKFKYLLTLTVFLCSFSISAQSNGISQLKYAYQSWKRNNTKLKQYEEKYKNDKIKCKNLEIENKSRIKELKMEMEKMRKEFQQGLFCDQCNRSKTEIEKETSTPFQQHLKDVNGKPYSASEYLINSKLEPYRTKISNLERDTVACYLDLKGTHYFLRNHQTYVNSNIQSANRAVRTINNYFSNQLDYIIEDKNEIIKKLNKAIDDINNIIQNIENEDRSYNLENVNLLKKIAGIEKDIKLKVSELEREIGTLTERKKDTLSNQNEIARQIDAKKFEISQTSENQKFNLANLQRELENSNESNIRERERKLNDIKQILNNDISDYKQALKNIASEANELNALLKKNISYVKNVILEMELEERLGISPKSFSQNTIKNVVYDLTFQRTFDLLDPTLLTIDNELKFCKEYVGIVETVKSSF